MRRLVAIGRRIKISEMFNVGSQRSTLNAQEAFGVAP